MQSVQMGAILRDGRSFRREIRRDGLRGILTCMKI
jgi:hypothetical protein